MLLLEQFELVDRLAGEDLVRSDVPRQMDLC